MKKILQVSREQGITQCTILNMCKSGNLNCVPVTEYGITRNYVKEDEKYRKMIEVRNMTNDDEYLNLYDSAKILNTSVTMVAKYIKKGCIQAKCIDMPSGKMKRYFIHRSELDKEDVKKVFTR